MRIGIQYKYIGGGDNFRFLNLNILNTNKVSMKKKAVIL